MLEQRIGNCAGGGLLDQSVLISPLELSWKATVPTLTEASSGFGGSRSWVVQASVNAAPFVSLTVTFSFVGVVWYAVSVHEYVQVASAGCGSQSLAPAGAGRASATRTPRSSVRRCTARKGSDGGVRPLRPARGSGAQRSLRRSRAPSRLARGCRARGRPGRRSARGPRRRSHAPPGP